MSIRVVGVGHFCAVVIPAGATPVFVVTHNILGNVFCNTEPALELVLLLGAELCFMEFFFLHGYFVFWTELLLFFARTPYSTLPVALDRLYTVQMLAFDAAIGHHPFAPARPHPYRRGLAGLHAADARAGCRGYGGL